MKNKKLNFLLLAFIFIGLVSLVVYVYTTFFLDKGLDAENQKIFEERIDSISSDIDENLHLYRRRFEGILSDEILKLFVKNIVSLEYSSTEDMAYISNVVRRGGLGFSSLTLYKEDGSVIFSFLKNNRNSLVDNKKSLNHEKFWDRVRNGSGDVANVYSYDDRSILSIGRVKSGGQTLGYLSLAIPNSIFHMSEIGSANYTLTSDAILYYTDELENAGYKVLNENIDRLFDTAEDYVVLNSVPYSIYISPENNGVITVAAAILDQSRTRGVLEYVILAIFIISSIFVAIFLAFFIKGRKADAIEQGEYDASEDEMDQLLSDDGDDNIMASLLGDDEEIDEIDIDEDLDIDSILDDDNNLDVKGDEILHDIEDMDEEELDKLWDKETSDVNDDIQDSLDDEIKVDDIDDDVLEDEPEVDDIDDDVSEDEPEVDDIDDDVSEDEPEVDDIDDDVSEDEPEVDDIDDEVLEDEPEVDDIDDDVSEDDLELDDIGSQSMEENNEIESLDGSTIDEELLKQEDEYLTSDDSFAFDGSDFLNILGDDDNVGDVQTEESLDDDMLEEPSEESVPKIPDDYYNQSDNSQSWNNVIDDSTFLTDLSDESFEDIIKLAREKLDINIDKALYLEYDNEDKVYKVTNSTGVQDDEAFTISTKEPFYTKLVAKNNIISIDNPMESDIIKSKFAESDYSGIERLLVVPLENPNHDFYKNLFIMLSISSPQQN